jgi:hypothetical protein
MKTSKKIIAFSLIILIFASFSGLFVFAETNATVSLVANKDSVKPGDIVTVNVNIDNLPETMTKINSGKIIIDYNSDAFTLQTANIEKDDVSITLNLENKPVDLGKCKVASLTFKAEKKYGDANFLVSVDTLKDENGSIVYDINPENLIISIHDYELKSLKVAEGELNKTFSKDVLNYSLSVQNNITNINVIAVPIDETMNTKIEITGDSGLKVGENVVKIIVAKTKTYTITVTRAGVASSSSSSSSSRSSQGKASVSIATYSRSESSSSQVSSAAIPQNNNEQETPMGLLLIVAILCAGFGGLGGYIIREYLYKKNKG